MKILNAGFPVVLSNWWNNKNVSSPIGLIAGQGEFPLIFAKAASSIQRELVLFGLEGYTDKRIQAFTKEAYYVGLGALQDLLDLLKKTKVRQVVLAGSVPKREIYNPSFQLDQTARSFLNGVRDKGDDHLLRAFQLMLKAKCGVSVADYRAILKDILAGRGVLTHRAPTEHEWSDLRFGWRIAKGIGKMDIGQAVVVKEGIVLAVEALEGTDQAIKRGGQLGGGEAVVVKVSKPKQDLRFDLPCVGFETLESLKSVSSKVLGVEAQKTILLRKQELIGAANESGITIVGL